MIFLIMIDFYSGYRTLCQSSINSRLFFIKENISSYPILEKLLGFTFELNNRLLPIYDKRIEDIPEPKNLNVTNEAMTEGSIVAACALNLHSIWHAIKPLEENSINNCANVIRSVYESIPKMFYVLRYPENIYFILLQEEFGLWVSQQKYRDIVAKKELLEDFEYLNQYLTEDEGGIKFQDRLNLTTSKTFYKSFAGKYNNQWYRNKIYTDESLKMQDTVYASLSQSSHANFTRSRREIKYDPVLSPQFFKILTDISFFNLYLFFNASYTAIAELDEIKDTNNFIQETQTELKSFYSMTYLYPDVPEYMENLVLYPEK